jgi:hypothetical protein
MGKGRSRRIADNKLSAIRGKIRASVEGKTPGFRFSVATAIQRESTIAAASVLAPVAKVYNIQVIEFAKLGMHVLTFLFFVGLAGSSVVVVISFVEDLAELLGE